YFRACRCLELWRGGASPFAAAARGIPASLSGAKMGRNGNAHLTLPQGECRNPRYVLCRFHRAHKDAARRGAQPRLGRCFCADREVTGSALSFLVGAWHFELAL